MAMIYILAQGYARLVGVTDGQVVTAGVSVT